MAELRRTGGDRLLVNMDSWRFLLIVMVVANHTMLLTTPEAEAGPLGRAVFILTRAGVPALSLFSGYLFAMMRDAPGPLLVKKARSLLLPFLAWNTAAAILVWSLVLWLPQLDQTLVPAGRYAMVNALTAFHGAPANAPLYFLRDLFVCFLALALLRPLLLRPAVFLAVIALALLNYALNLDGRLFIRDTIPLFLLAGFGLRRFPQAVAACGMALVPLAAAAAVLVAIWAAGEARWGGASLLDLLTLGTFAALVVGLASRLRPWPRLASWGRRYSFVIFLSHWWALLALEALWDRMRWNDLSYQVLAVAGAVLSGMALAHLIGVLPGPLAAALSGGRVRRRAAATAPA